MADMLPALGIDIGGGSAKIGIVSADGHILAQGVIASDPTVTAAKLLDRYLNETSRLQQEFDIPKLAGIGLGLPGHIDFVSGTTRLCNVPSLNEFAIVEYLSGRSGYPVFIENDATLAAIGEHRFGSGRGSSRFLAVTLGTGIGVGFIENGMPIHTANGTLGDIGHMIIDPKGTRSCRQGCRGCLESIASATALQERYENISGALPDNGLVGLFASARSGNIECKAIIDEAALSIAAALTSWMHIFAPDRIAIGGGMSAAGDDFLNFIRKSVMHLALAEYSSGVKILSAELGNSAGLIGAAALCFNEQSKK